MRGPWTAATPAGRRKYDHAEAREQEALVQWASYSSVPVSYGLAGFKIGDFLFAIPNGSHLAGDEAARARQRGILIKLGLMKGAADLFLSLATATAHGLYIEMKKPRELFRSPSEAERAWSDEQRAFAERVQSAGYRYALAYGWPSARECIERHLRW